MIKSFNIQTLFLLLCVLSYSTNAYSDADGFVTAFKKYLTSEVQPMVPGYAVGIITPDDTHTITAGVRTVRKAETFDENTLFRLASVSKTFTSAAVLALKIPSVNFDSALVSYLPNLTLSNKHYQKKITLGHVLSQTSGLLPHAYTNLIQDNVPYKNIVERLHEVNFVCEPGNCYSYQNIVYNLAGDAIAQAGNSSYEEIVREKIFQALGMNSSSFGLSSFLQNENRATPHKRSKSKKRWYTTQPKENYYQLSSSAGINTNLSDMLKWLEAQLGKHPEVLSDTDLKILHAPRITHSRKRSNFKKKSWNGVSNIAYALGWRTFNFKGQNGFVHHGGWVDGFRAEIILNRQLNIGLFFVTNSEPRISSDIVPTFINMYLKHIDKKEKIKYFSN